MSAILDHKSDMFEAETNYNHILREANDYLVHKDFEQCLKICRNSIDEARNYPEIPEAVQAVEHLSLVAIQAFAELNRWQEVLPYITQVFSGIEDCPPKVVQLCVLLHAHMKDYTTSTAVAHIWLRNPHNLSNSQYSLLVEIFLLHVLVPQKRWKDVPAFLEGCPGLNEEKRQIYKKQINQIHKAEETQLAQLQEESIAKEHAMKAKKMAKKSSAISHSKVHGALALVHKMALAVRKCIPVVPLNILKNMALIGLIVYLLITRANLDFISNSHLLNIFKTIHRLWRAMFAPFHLSR